MTAEVAAPAVSVVIAAYDEAAAIGDVVRAAFAAVPGVEVIVADDGSRDDTSGVARSAGARVIRSRENHGKGHAASASGSQRRVAKSSS